MNTPLPLPEAASATRLAEIQDNIERHALPDGNWAEPLISTPDGTWTQAFMIRDGKVFPITDVIWVPRETT